MMGIAGLACPSEKLGGSLSGCRKVLLLSSMPVQYRRVVPRDEYAEGALNGNRAHPTLRLLCKLQIPVIVLSCRRTELGAELAASLHLRQNLSIRQEFVPSVPSQDFDPCVRLPPARNRRGAAADESVQILQDQIQGDSSMSVERHEAMVRSKSMSVQYEALKSTSSSRSSAWGLGASSIMVRVGWLQTSSIRSVQASASTSVLQISGY